MAITASVQIKGSIKDASGLVIGNTFIESTPVTTGTANPESKELTCTTGLNTFSFSAGKRGLILTLPSAATTTKRLTASTGLIIATSGRGGSMFLTQEPAQPELVIHCSGLDTLETKIQLF